MTAPSPHSAPGEHFLRWQWPIDSGRYDTKRTVRAAEKQAIVDLACSTCGGWPAMTRLPRSGGRSAGCCGLWTTPLTP
ncbi:hypothetical protein D3C57_143630 [Streptomyces rapamycinicus NRRL 5491]|uniref:Uncharacterized protein n=1 Tax=Streptomyces rapamycinicus (strain ATCC 29253 / DSM 41530 / NRRL 5491 / AYB-994) TaxID=1343740 RepID=A0A3L8R9I8_STRRN|nr:hypothetical protein D3C57_143630 [Streptomyces rapamycinicus NRRL 5491]